jgi:hypothetical protein
MGTITIVYDAKCKSGCKFFRARFEGKRTYHKCDNQESKENGKKKTLKSPACDDFEFD